MSGKSSPEFEWTDHDIQLLLEATQNLKVEKDYKGLNWELTLGLTLNVSSHKLKSERCDILKFFFPFFRNHVSINEIIQSF